MFVFNVVKGMESGKLLKNVVNAKTLFTRLDTMVFFAMGKAIIFAGSV